jgi:hypothetical protein
LPEKAAVDKQQQYINNLLLKTSLAKIYFIKKITGGLYALDIYSLADNNLGGLGGRGTGAGTGL